MILNHASGAACTRPPLFFTFPWLPARWAVCLSGGCPFFFPLLPIFGCAPVGGVSERRATLVFTHDTHGGCESNEPFTLFLYHLSVLNPVCKGISVAH